MEQTYVMIKPDGVQRSLIGTIISRIESKGLKIAAMKMGVMERAKAEEHYSEHVERPFFKDLVDFITSSPSVSMVIEGNGAIATMRTVNGATNPMDAAPGTVRGDFALDMGRNLVHASDSPESAKREIAIHFTESEIVEYTRIDKTWLYE